MPRLTPVAAWCVFDWAIAPYPTLVTTFVFSTYFAQAIAPDPTLGSATWSFMVALAGIAIGLLSPPLGAIADRMGHIKPAIALFAGITAVTAGLLWFARPEPGYALPVLVVVGVGITALELCLLFYTALLPRIATKARLGRASGWGWASGYAGGLACLIVALLFLIQPEQPIFGIPKTAAANIRACGPLLLIWMIVFGWPLFTHVPDNAVTRAPARVAVREGLREIRRTFAELRALPDLARFLIASAIYRDGITTILAIGGLYAGVTFGMKLNEVIIFGIALNVAAGLGAAGFAWVDDWIGSKRTIVIAVIGLIVFGAGIIAVRDKETFMPMAIALGIFIGPAQAASRSMIVHLSPPAKIGQFLGFYALTGRAVSFVGPALFGLVTAIAHSQRAGLSVILLLLVIGVVLLGWVKYPVPTRTV